MNRTPRFIGTRKTAVANAYAAARRVDEARKRREAIAAMSKIAAAPKPVPTITSGGKTHKAKIVDSVTLASCGTKIGKPATANVTKCRRCFP